MALVTAIFMYQSSISVQILLEWNKLIGKDIVRLANRRIMRKGIVSFQRLPVNVHPKPIYAFSLWLIFSFFEGQSKPSSPPSRELVMQCIGAIWEFRNQYAKKTRKRMQWMTWHLIIFDSTTACLKYIKKNSRRFDPRAFVLLKILVTILRWKIRDFLFILSCCWPTMRIYMKNFRGAVSSLSKDH